MSNLPPGVTESMIPGNRPEDIELEKFHNQIIEMLEESIGKSRAAHFFEYIDKGDWEEVLMEYAEIAAGLAAARAVMEMQYEKDLERLENEANDT